MEEGIKSYAIIVMVIEQEEKGSRRHNPDYSYYTDLIAVSRVRCTGNK